MILFYESTLDNWLDEIQLENEIILSVFTTA